MNKKIITEAIAAIVFAVAAISFVSCNDKDEDVNQVVANKKSEEQIIFAKYNKDNGYIFYDDIEYAEKYVENILKESGFEIVMENISIEDMYPFDKESKAL